MKIANKDLIQSYIFTVARFDFSVYERRILYRLCEHAQRFIEGKELKGKYKLPDDVPMLPITMKLSDFLKNEKDNNYTQAKEALKSLDSKCFEYEDQNIWTKIRLITSPIIMKNESSVHFLVPKQVFEAIIDFTKGYRKFELKTIFEFKSAYAMRFYEMFSEQKTTIVYGVDQLRDMFQLGSKYSSVADLKAKVIDKAKKELDKNSPYSFRYEPLKTGRKITAFKFTPYFIAKNQDPDLEKKRLQKQVSVSFQLDRNIVDYLRDFFDFTPDEIKRNIDLFGIAHDKIDFLNWMSGIKARAIDAKNPKGYMINALKGHLKDPKNFTK